MFRRMRFFFSFSCTSAAIFALLVVVIGCEPRPPITRGQAAAIAGNVCLGEGLAWGEPTEVLAPDQADAEGHRWWQVRYFYGPGEAPRVVLVDDASGWGRRPGSGQAIRIAAVPHAVAASGDSSALPVRVSEGAHVLVLVEPAERQGEDLAAIERESARLNTLASQDGLPPLFAARSDGHGRTSLLYGWQGDHGIAADERLRSWVAQQGYSQPRWVDLLAESP